MRGSPRRAADLRLPTTQVQERLCNQIAQAVNEAIAPQGCDRQTRTGTGPPMH
jgi:GTP cyclohydrolase I